MKHLGIAIFLVCAIPLCAAAQTEPTSQPAPAPSPYLTGDWLGVRSKLADKGIVFDIELTVDGTKDLSGGLNTRSSAWRNLFEATVMLDTKPLFGLEDGKAFVDFQNEAGRNGTDSIVGDLQQFDGLDANGRTQIGQLWYEQTLFNGFLRIKAGKVDAAAEFDKPDNGVEFLNTGLTQTTTFIEEFPTYPDPATAFNVFVNPGDDFYLGAGVYDGSLIRGVETGAQGPRTFFRDPEDLFYIAEAGKRWNTTGPGLPGRVSIGGWFDTNRFQRFEGGHTTGTGGLYAVFDQTVWRPVDAASDDMRGIGIFALAGQSDGALIDNPIDAALAGGFAWTGPIPTRDTDILGVGIAAAHLSTSAIGLRTDHEVALEAFYKVRITPWFNIKPDLQYITAPGGMHPDAVVATIRFNIVF